MRLKRRDSIDQKLILVASFCFVSIVNNTLVDEKLDIGADFYAEQFCLKFVFRALLFTRFGGGLLFLCLKADSKFVSLICELHCCFKFMLCLPLLSALFE